MLVDCSVDGTVKFHRTMYVNHIFYSLNQIFFLLSFQIISKDLSDPVRSHKDLDKDAAPYYKKAVKFYDSIAKQLVAQGHVLDLFASALDQV